jgi:two-component system chemotaxis response regulator CheY
MKMFDTPAAEAPSAPVARAALTALIVDDEAHVRTYLRVTLQSLGIVTMWESVNGADALELYAQHAPSVVFLDVNMPTMPGVETLQRLLCLDPAVNVIVVTSDSEHETVRHFLDLGAIGYVLKQRPAGEFRRALREFIDRLTE